LLGKSSPFLVANFSPFYFTAYTLHPLRPEDTLTDRM